MKLPGKPGRVVVGVCLCVLVGPVSDGPVFAGSEITIEKIFQAWKKREEAVRTIHFSWAETRTHGKGSLPNMDSMARVGARPAPDFKPKITPPEDVTHQIKAAVSIEGDLMRFTVDGPRWEADVEDFVHLEYTSVFDGTYNKAFLTEPKGSTPFPDIHKTGFLAEKKCNDDVVDYHLWPVIFTWRAAHPTMGRFKAGEWQMTREKSVVDQRPCVVLRKSQDGVTETCFVDVERNYSILRYHMAAPNNPVHLQLTISYKNDERHGWVPSQWTVNSQLPRGGLDESTVTIVRSYEINATIKLGTFQFEFPRGTQVTDYTQKPIGSFIALGGGRQRAITDEERLRGATYKDLMETETGMAGLPRARGWSQWWLPGLLIAAVTMTGFLVWKRRLASKLGA